MLQCILPPNWFCNIFPSLRHILFPKLHNNNIVCISCCVNNGVSAPSCRWQPGKIMLSRWCTDLWSMTYAAQGNKLNLVVTAAVFVTSTCTSVSAPPAIETMNFLHGQKEFLGYTPWKWPLPTSPFFALLFLNTPLKQVGTTHVPQMRRECVSTIYKFSWVEAQLPIWGPTDIIIGYDRLWCWSECLPSSSQYDDSSVFIFIVCWKIWHYRVCPIVHWMHSSTNAVPIVFMIDAHMLPFILLIAQSQNWTLGSHKVMLMHSLANLVQSTTLLLRVVVKNTL